jgi:hypothetical protein
MVPLILFMLMLYAIQHDSYGVAVLALLAMLASMSRFLFGCFVWSVLFARLFRR